MIKFLLRTLLTSILMLAIPIASIAGIYKYRDADGRLNFVDDESRIPPQYRDKTTSISEAKGSASVYDSHNDNNNLAATPSLAKERTESAAARKKLQAYQTQVEISGNRVLVPVEVAMGNRTAKLSLLLDTGATTTVLHRNSLTGLELPSGKEYKARVAGGGTLKSEKIKFRQISVGPFQEKKVYAMVINQQGKKLPYDGMLGMDFLKRHPYQINFQKELITWENLD